MIRFSIIIAAAGSGTRFDSGDQKKTYVLLGGKPLWLHSVERFAQRDDVSQILIVVSPEDADWFAQTHATLVQKYQLSIVAGGNERFESVENALREVAADCEFVAVHDAARPSVSSPLIERLFATAREQGNAIPVVPVSSTLKRSAGAVYVDETVSRDFLYESQTPQVFRVAELRAAFDQRSKTQPTDEAQLMEMLGHRVFLADGCSLNQKVTTQKDLLFAEAALKLLSTSESSPIRFDGPIDETKLR